MNTVSRVVVVCLLMVGCMVSLPACGGGNSHEAVAEKMASVMNEFASILATVKDDASAKTAATKLTSLGTKIKSINIQLDKLPEPSDEVKKKLEAKFEGVQKKVMDEMMRIGLNIPSAIPILEEGLSALDGLN